MRHRVRRLAPVLLVLVLAPVTAEYLIGYDDITGNVAAYLFGLLFFGPLYGAPAVLVRELTRRRGLGWPTMLLLATAFGLVEAGLIDQSLFDPSYRDISFWDTLREPTFLPWFGTSAFMLLSFVAGHVFGSILAPIVLAESWWPDRQEGPWLGPVGTGVLVVLWLAGAGFVLGDQLASTTFRPSVGQLVGTAVVVVGLVVLALTRRRPVADRPGSVPAPWVVGVVSCVLLLPRTTVLTDWVSTSGALAAIVVWLALLGRWSTRGAWDGRHLVAAAIGDLASIGGPAFFLTPLGHVPLPAKLAADLGLLALVLAVAWRGYVVQARVSDPRPATA